MPKFSFLIPTRNRPDLLNRLFQSILDTTDCLDEIEIVLCLDNDDVESQKISNDKLDIKKIILPHGSSMGELNTACFNVSSGNYVMLLNDDVIIRTKSWDKIISFVLSMYPDEIVLIHTNDLLFRENLCTFPILSKISCQEIGLCPLEYQRYRIDDHIYDTYNILAYLGYQRIVYLPDVIFEHDNYTYDNNHDKKSQIFRSEENKIYIPNQKILELDALTFDNKLDERKEDALKLVKLINKFEYKKNQYYYRQKLRKIKDSNKYRKSNYIKKIEGHQVSFLLNPSITIVVISSDILKRNAVQCLTSIKKYTSHYDLIILDSNNGKKNNYANEMNKVFQIVKSDYLIFMDDDVLVGKGWIDGLLKSIDNETGAVSPLFRERKDPISSVFEFFKDNRIGNISNSFETFDEPKESHILNSALVMINLKKCRNLSFNPIYQSNFKDLDYALKIWEAGHKVISTPYTVVTRLDGYGSSHFLEGTNFWETRDKKIFIDFWINTGRLSQIETNIWSKYPSLPSLLCIMQNIDNFFKDADNLKFNPFKFQLESLIETTIRLKLFNSEIITHLQQYIISCYSKGDITRAEFCENIESKFFPLSREKKIKIGDTLSFKRYDISEKLSKIKKYLLFKNKH